MDLFPMAFEAGPCGSTWMPPGKLSEYQSEHHSQTLPSVSYRPHGFGSFRPTGCTERLAFGCIPRVVCQARCVRVIAVTETRGSAGARSVFPFGFRRQAIRRARGNSSGSQFQLRALGAIIGGIDPTHARYGAVRVRGEKAGIDARDRQVLAFGDFKFSNPESAGEDHGSLWPVFNASVEFVGGAAHDKTVRREIDHVGRRG